MDSRTAQSAANCSRWFLAGGFLYPEEEGDTFLRNVGSHKNYTAPNSRKQHSSSLYHFKIHDHTRIALAILAYNCSLEYFC
jgi:hypothetical protein